MHTRVCVAILALVACVATASFPVVSHRPDPYFSNGGGANDLRISVASVFRAVDGGMHAHKAGRGRMPCKMHDSMCWCTRAVKYTNFMRTRKGLPMLKMGTQKQMDDAMWYAKKLSVMGYLKRRYLPAVTRKVGCKRWIGAENLALNYAKGDVAMMCVTQWMKSSMHYKYMMGAHFQETVVGFHFDMYGKVYCVQTFAMYSKRMKIGHKYGPRCHAAAHAHSM